VGSQEEEASVNPLTFIVIAVMALWGPGASEVAAAAAATINQAGTCVRVGPPSQADYTVEISTEYVYGFRWGYLGQGGRFSVAVDRVRATAVTRKGRAIAGVVEVESPVTTLGIWAGPFGLSGPLPVRYGEIGRELARKLLTLLERECPPSGSQGGEDK
jgi:hypothetical protein